MPTLYSALRAKHRQTLRVPADQRARLVVAAAPRALLAGERHLMVTQGGSGQSESVGAPRRRIGIVGAGFAGLCAAYELRALGYDVTIFEARDRVGGRVHSSSHLVPGRVVECGGELVGGNHPLWQFYGRHFGFKFSDVKDYGNSPIRLGGHTLSFEDGQRLTDQMELEFKLLTDLAETIVDPFEPWASADATALDEMSLWDWLAKSRTSQECREAVAAQLAADNGVAATEQSLLGVLAMIRGGGLDRYWLDSEVYRCEGGNQQLAEAFRGKLNEGAGLRVRTQAYVRAVQRTGSDAVLVVNEKDQQEKREKVSEFPCDDVILAVPPSVWHRIEFRIPGLAEILRRPPDMGSNVKYIMRLGTRFWREFGSSPNLTEDGPIDLTWETTEAEHKGDFAWVAFSGAKDSEICRSWPAESRRREYEKALKTYPGVASQIRADEFFDWPGEEWTQASYYFPRKAEVTRWGPRWKAGFEDWFHFAGEHTCFAFVGYMEGALQSGYRLARRLAVRDGLLIA